MPQVTQDKPGAILFNDGEGLDYNDLNDLQSLVHRALGDRFLRHRIFAGDEGDLRTIGSALEVVCNGTSAILIYPGTFMFRLTAIPPEPDYGFLAVDSSTELGLTIPNNSLGGPRWDIISVKVEQVTGGSETRDFKDATTGALTTTTFDKRRQLRITFDQTLGTVASTEPPVPAGFTKIARIEVPNGGAVAAESDVRDFRVPAGYTRIVLSPNTHFGEGSWQFNSASQSTWTNPGTTPGQLLHMPVQGFLQYHEARDLNVSSMRLASVHFSGLLGPTGAFKIVRKSNQFGGSNVELLDISSILTLGTGGDYHKDMAAEEPIWSNGRSAPSQISGADDMATLALRALSGNTSSDAIHGIGLEFWGGIF